MQNGKSRIHIFAGLVVLTVLLSGTVSNSQASPIDQRATFMPRILPPFSLGIAQFQTQCGKLVETTLPIPSDIHQSISDILCTRPATVLPGDYSRLILTSFDFLSDNSWASATVVMRPTPMPRDYESLLQFPSLMLIAHRAGTNWEVGIEGTDLFDQILRQTPRSVLSDQARKYLPSSQSSRSPAGIPGSLNLKWPWKDSQAWLYSNGPHKWNTESVLSSLDFAPPLSIAAQDRQIRSAAAGTVIRKCTTSSIQTDVILSNANNYTTGYLHLDKNSASGLVVGQAVQQGDSMGYTYNGRDWSDNCGRGTGPHVHFYVGTGSTSNNFQFDSIVGTVISGWTLQSNRCFTKSGQSDKCQGSWITSDNTPAAMITIGQSVNGEINPAGEQDNYYFDGTAGQNVTIAMTKVSGSVDPYILLYRPNGTYLTYDDDGAGYPNALIRQTLPDSGRYRIIARSWSASQTGAYTLGISAGSGDTDDGRWLAQNQQLNGTINPASDQDWYYFSGVQGRIVSIQMNRSGGSLDSYLELYSPSGSFITYDDDGGGTSTRDSWLVTTLSASGTYRVKARSYRNASSGGYTIRLGFVDPTNYALNRSAWASSSQGSTYVPVRAFDGRTDTRWSSQFSDNQWIYVDLGQNRTFDNVILRWETAYGRRFGIDVWTGSNWSRVFWTDNGRGGTDNIRFAARTARYVRMYGLQRGTPWGFSLWEFGVYYSAFATVPLVPPGDPDKTPDDVSQTTPLPLPEEGGGKDVIALFLGDGDVAQEIPTPPDVDPGDMPIMSLGLEGNPIASIDGIIPGFPGGGTIVYRYQTLEFSGSAQDNDVNGDPGIVAYEWRSDRNGLLSNQPSFMLSASLLDVGQHVISFRAQDNEGNWSEWSQATIDVLPVSLYLPFVIR